MVSEQASGRKVAACVGVLSLCVLMPSLRPPVSGDWPCYRGDPARTGVADEPLEFPLAIQWSYESDHEPRPAWPDAVVADGGRAEKDRINFDDAFDPVVADKTVFFGSNADDSVRALELGTGSVKWTFVGGGPVRFSPHVADGRCYFASDDGFAYCLEALTGRQLWKVRVAPGGQQIIGNKRMISRWPCRSGVLLVDDVLYVAAGMWPAEGVYIYALDPQSGATIWCNDTSNFLYRQHPHEMYSFTGVAPQGYMAASDDVLLVPTGRALPAAYDRQTGELVYHHAPSKLGGVFVAVDREAGIFFNGHSLQRGGLGAYTLSEGAPVQTDRRPVPNRALKAGETVVSGEEGFVVARRNGNEVWRQQVNGTALSFAAAHGRLVVGTTTGDMYCFGAARTTQAALGRGQTVPSADVSGAEGGKVFPLPNCIEELIRRPELSRGYAVVFGEPDAGLGESLAAHTQLHVIAAIRDPRRANEERLRLLRSPGFYGSRVAVQVAPGGEPLTYPMYFANFVIISNQGESPAAGELYRILHPCGGTICMLDAQGEIADAFPLATEDYVARLERFGDALAVVRGKLPGAFDWDSDIDCDQRLKWPMELLWFGGPGPARALSRQACGTPVVADGRYFVFSNNGVIAMDAYNGCELWAWESPEPLPQRRSLAARGNALYVALGDRVFSFDARTGNGGEVAGAVPEWARRWGRMPVRTPRVESQWGNRRHPLLSVKAMKTYVKAAGCGGTIRSATMDFFRSETIGIYDFVDDTGLRTWPGVRPSCSTTPGSVSLMPALGLLISPEGSRGCACSFNFQGSLALAPSQNQRNEDWAVFADTTELHGLVLKHLALNFGAPGDRRDASGALWMGFPRPTFTTGTPRGGGHKAMPASLGVPCSVEASAGFGTYRFNADSWPSCGSKRPWIYASGYRGVRKVVLDLLTQDPRFQATSLKCGSAPRIDGVLSEYCWDAAAQTSLEHEDATVLFRHDEMALYVGYRRRVDWDRQGAPRRPQVLPVNKDAPAWEGDALEIALADSERPRQVIHLGVSAAGERYDGRWYNGFEIPFLQGVSVDAADKDWGEEGFLLELKGRASLRLAWDSDSLLVSGKVDKKGGPLLLLFARAGSKDYWQISLDAGNGTYAIESSHAGSDTAAGSLIRTAGDDENIAFEASIPWESLGVAAQKGEAVLFVPMTCERGTAPPAVGGEADPRPLLLGGPSYVNFAHGVSLLRLAESPSAPSSTEVPKTVLREIDPMLYSHYHMGGSGLVRSYINVPETDEWDGEWSSGVRANEEFVTVELAIPWSTLRREGLDVNSLLVNLRKRGKQHAQFPVMRKELSRLSHRLLLHDSPPPQRLFTVRLHFAEPDEIEAGTRVFDVRLQGRTVLKDLDVARDAGGSGQALIREIEHVAGSATLTVEFIPKVDGGNATTVPILSGIEVFDESSGPLGF